MSEFSPEQRVVIAAMRVNGVADPEAIVRQDRVAAYLLGSHLLPALRAVADEMTALIKVVLGEDEP